MSVRVTINGSVNTSTTEELIDFLVKNLPNVRNFDGCNYVDVLFNKTREEMLLDEQWSSIEQHQNYIEHISNNGVLGKLASFLTEPPQIKYFEKEEI